MEKRKQTEAVTNFSVMSSHLIIPIGNITEEFRLQVSRSLIVWKMVGIELKIRGRKLFYELTLLAHLVHHDL